VLTAPAGMVPMRALTAPAGMVPMRVALKYGATRAPRARGDGPTTNAGGSGGMRCSPRPRGWSRSDAKITSATSHNYGE
jgi:hypothetical protein